MLAALHGTIGIQHAAMSIYQAYYDRCRWSWWRAMTWISFPRTPRWIWRGWFEALQMGRPAGDRGGCAGGDSARVQRSHYAGRWDYSVVLSSEIPKSKLPEVQTPKYKAPQMPGHRHQHGRRDRERAALPAQNPGSRWGVCEPPKARQRVRGNSPSWWEPATSTRGDVWALSFPAASSAVRAGRRHELRLCAWS